MNSPESAAERRQQQQHLRSQHLCNGYNIEQRECNLFECKGRNSEKKSSAIVTRFLDGSELDFDFRTRV